jgi:phosphoglycerate dehydrogenase-like enzyme
VEPAATLHDLLRQADVVSLHAPLSGATRGLIGAAEIALLRPEAMLVNTARAGLVDEAAVIAALREGRLRGAALDVRPIEPPPPDLHLPDVPNLIQTPHMGAATTIARAATARVAAAHLLDVLLGRPLPPDACVNPEVLARR